MITNIANTNQAKSNFNQPSPQQQHQQPNNMGGQVQQPQPQPQQQPPAYFSDDSNEAWKIFIRTREPFSCMGRMDGFYASRWCNVFYRCFLSVKTEFLCPKMLNSDRLWWVQHGSPQETPQTSAACVWPCESKKKCQSPGGLVVETAPGKYEESLGEADRVWRAASCQSESNRLNDMFKIQDQDFNCMGLPDGNFYASKYCNVFHRCTNGKRRDFQCPKAIHTSYDLWWNDEKQQCDWPCKVRCQKPIYGSSKTSLDIQSEDRQLNEAECRLSTANNPQPQPHPQYNAKNSNYALQFQFQQREKQQKQPEQQQQEPPQIQVVASTKSSSPVLQPQSSTTNEDHAIISPLLSDELSLINQALDFEEPIATKGETQQQQPPSFPTPQAQKQFTFNDKESFVQSEQIGASFMPDEGLICRTIGLVSSLKYCNVYYKCKMYGQTPSETFYCQDGYFDNNRKACSRETDGQCVLNPPLIYPFISIQEIIPPEEFACSNQVIFF
jgi:hypothetical protein